MARKKKKTYKEMSVIERENIMESIFQDAVNYVKQIVPPNTIIPRFIMPVEFLEDINAYPFYRIDYSNDLWKSGWYIKVHPMLLNSDPGVAKTIFLHAITSTILKDIRVCYE